MPYDQLGLLQMNKIQQVSLTLELVQNMSHIVQLYMIIVKRKIWLETEWYWYCIEFY